MYQHYSSPEGFDFDTMQDGVQPIVDDPTLETYNVNERVAAFRDWIEHQN